MLTGTEGSRHHLDNQLYKEVQDYYYQTEGPTTTRKAGSPRGSVMTREHQYLGTVVARLAGTGELTGVIVSSVIF